ncbi:MAG: sialidase family protein [Burkholderiales bacterium]
MQITHSRGSVYLFSVIMAFLSACGGGGGGTSAGVEPPANPVVGQEIRVSRTTAFPPGCEGVGSAGTLYANAEVEPTVAVNPFNPNNIIGAWQASRWSNGGSQALATGVSNDGGLTWSARSVPFSRCTGGNAGNGGDYERASDPWVAIAPDGVAVQIALAFNGAVLSAGSASAILASRSVDGGNSWTPPATLIRDGSAFFNDKGAITADKTDPRKFYVVWDRLESEDTGPTFFARSVNSGQAWESARPIYQPGARKQTLGNQIVILPDGNLVNYFTQIDTAADGSLSAALGVVRSADKGDTWSQAYKVADLLPVGSKDPETGTKIRDGALLGAIAVSPGGELFSVWQDARFTGGVRDGIVMSRSADGGVTWSSPARINNTPDVQAFTPTIRILTDGTIGVSYFDLRSNTADARTLPTEYWLTRSLDGTNWRETRITPTFDLATAPFAGGFFLGDYQALAGTGNAFMPFYVRTNSAENLNRTDVFAILLNSMAGVAAERTVVSRGIARSLKMHETDPQANIDAAFKRKVSAAISTGLQQRSAKMRLFREDPTGPAADN